MARWLIHGIVVGVALIAVAMGMRSSAPPPSRPESAVVSADPYSLAWTAPLQQMAPTFWGVWHPDEATIAALPSALQGVRAVALAIHQAPHCAVHLRVLCLDDTAALLATEALEGIIAMAVIEHRYIPWLTPSLRSVSVHRTAHLIDLTMLCTTPQLKTLLQELGIL